MILSKCDHFRVLSLFHCFLDIYLYILVYPGPFFIQVFFMFVMPLSKGDQISAPKCEVESVSILFFGCFYYEVLSSVICLFLKHFPHQNTWILDDFYTTCTLIFGASL